MKIEKVKKLLNSIDVEEVNIAIPVTDDKLLIDLRKKGYQVYLEKIATGMQIVVVNI